MIRIAQEDEGQQDEEEDDEPDEVVLRYRCVKCCVLVESRELLLSDQDEALCLVCYADESGAFDEEG